MFCSVLCPILLVLIRAQWQTLCGEWAARDHTVTFEWVSPDNRIVLHYAEPDLVLTAIRHNRTGQCGSSLVYSLLCSH